MQKISCLTNEMTTYLDVKRNWVKEHYVPESTHEYNSISGKLKLLDTILESNWIENNETYKLQSLGVTLGDIFVQDLNFIWVEVNDEYGNAPALQMPDTTLIVFPLTMIS